MTIENGSGAGAPGTVDRARAVAAVKAALRVTLAEDDARIGAVVDAALGIAEQFTGRVLIAREVRETVAADRCWRRLSARPVRAIARVEADDVALPVASYAIDLDGGETGWVRATAPSTGPDAGAAIGRVTAVYLAGLADGWDALPAPLREGVVLLAAHLVREGEAARVPAAVAALWRPFRTLSLRLERHG